MQFYVQYEYFTGYGSVMKRKKVSKEQFIWSALSNSAIGDKDLLGIVTTNIDREKLGFNNFFRDRNLHFMGLDCDSFEDVTCAILHLDEHKINWARIDSGNDKHYWLITDYVGTIDDILKKMSCIVGVDPAYVDVCRAYRSCIFRATPATDKHIPKVSDMVINNLTDERILNWLKEYCLLIYQTKTAFKNFKLRKALKRKQLFEYLAQQPHEDEFA